MTDLSTDIIRIQGDGDYAKAGAWLKEKGVIGKQLQADLDRLDESNIPVDVFFKQGEKVLGL